MPLFAAQVNRLPNGKKQDLPPPHKNSQPRSEPNCVRTILNHRRPVCRKQRHTVRTAANRGGESGLFRNPLRRHAVHSLPCVADRDLDRCLHGDHLWPSFSGCLGAVAAARR